MKYFKPVAYTFLAILLVWLFYISYQAKTEISESVQTNNNTESTPLAAVPVQEDNLNYSGTIREDDNSTYKYSLEKNGKVILYLKSDNQDLSFLSGLEVDVVGDIQGRFEEVAIMDVRSIKLK